MLVTVLSNTEMLRIIFHQLLAFVDNDFEPLPYGEEDRIPPVAFSHSKS